MKHTKLFSLMKYLEKALEMAEYFKDENGVVIGRVPNISGFFSQGKNFEEARVNLRDAIEGNILLALQLGLDIPKLEGIEIEEKEYAETHPSKT
jgi:predicted RNase H-like HicB family nuclease